MSFSYSRKIFPALSHEEELDLEIIDLPYISEASSTCHAWLWHTVLHVQRAVNPRSQRLIQTCFTLLLAFIAMLLLLSSILHPLASSPVFTPDQQELFASSNPIHYDRNPLSVYRGHSRTVTGIAWSPNGALIASSGQDGTWNAFLGQSIITFLSQANSVAWSPGSSFIATGGADSPVKLWFIARPTAGEHAVHESLFEIRS